MTMRHSTFHRSLFWLPGLLIVLMYSSIVVGVANDGKVLDQLKSEDYDTRHEMTRKLLQDQSLSHEDLIRLMSETDSEEQRQRLFDVARHHTLRRIVEEEFPDEGGGSLGVSHRPISPEASPGITQAAILVADTIPGFPAHAHLEVGDLILSVDGQALPERIAAEQFKNLIQDRHCGDRIELTINRRGVSKQVNFIMSSAAALGKMYGGNPISLQPPYTDRWHAVREELQNQVPGVQVLDVPEPDQ